VRRISAPLVSGVLVVECGFGQLAKGGSPMKVLRVSARSRSTAVAGAIAGVVRERGRAEVQAIGAGAVNQATKAVAIARGYLAEDGIDVICIPTFVDVLIGDLERTAIKRPVAPSCGTGDIYTSIPSSRMGSIRRPRS